MKKMKWLLFVLPSFFAFTSHDGRDRTQKAIALLTQKEWVLTGYGFDKNNNGDIDDAENELLDCEKDNTYIFCANGTGSWLDNKISCGNGVGEMQFNWKINTATATLHIQNESKELLLLDVHQLILYKKIIGKNGNSVKNMMVFKH